MTSKEDLKAEAEVATARLSSKEYETTDVDRKDLLKASEPHLTKDGLTEAPPMPVRRVSSFEKNLDELRDAFPNADPHVRRAVLVAAGGRLESAFNGMLALTDETIRPSNPPPPRVRRNSSYREREGYSPSRRSYDSRGSYDRLHDRQGYGHSHEDRRDRFYHREYDRDDRSDHSYHRDYSDDDGGSGRRVGSGYSARYDDPPPRRSRSRSRLDAVDNDLGLSEFGAKLQYQVSDTGKKISNFWKSLRDRVGNELSDDDDDRYLLQAGPRFSSQKSSHRTSTEKWYGSERGPYSGDPRHRCDRRYDPMSRSPVRPRRPIRPVNAFGDEHPTRWEPLRSRADNDAAQNAFYIGESEDEVNSLLDIKRSPSPTKSFSGSRSSIVESLKSDGRRESRDSRRSSIKPEPEDPLGEGPSYLRELQEDSLLSGRPVGNKRSGRSKCVSANDTSDPGMPGIKDASASTVAFSEAAVEPSSA